MSKMIWGAFAILNFVGFLVPPLDLRSVGNLLIALGCAAFCAHHAGVRL